MAELAPTTSSMPQQSTQPKRLIDGLENIPPSENVLKKAGNCVLFDQNGKATPFSSLYSGENSTRRTLVLFIRHFFCGNCQEYLRFLAKEIPQTSLSDDLRIKIIGCGTHTLIKSYIDQLNCSPPFPYPIFADPTKTLYELLGMHYSLSLGSKSPEYIHRSLIRVNLESTVQGFKRLLAGDALSGGDMRLNGGEFLFERDSRGLPSVSWCHRMLNSRDHAEIEVLKKVLKTGQPKEATVTAERPGIGHRTSTADRLRRSLSNRRESWLGRTASLSRTRSNKESSRDPSRRRSPNQDIGVVREEARSRDGAPKLVTSAMNGKLKG